MTSPSNTGHLARTVASTVATQNMGEQQFVAYQRDQPQTALAMVQPAVTVTPADHVLTLVSSAVVNQRGFANTCGVPLGAHMDLQPSEALRLPRIDARPPLRCNGCSAFLNVYCKANLPKGVWKCYMCGTVNIQKDQIGEATDVAAFPELSYEAVEYSVALPPVHPLVAQAGPMHLLFAVDTTLEPQDLQAVREALMTTLTSPSLDPSTLVSLITFDGCVAVHNLGPHRLSHVLPIASASPVTGVGGGSTAAQPIPSSSLDMQSAVQQLLERHCRATVARRATSSSSGSSSIAAGTSALVSDVRSCAVYLSKVLGSLRTVQSDVAVRARARCLCSAVEAALRLIAAHAALDLTRHHNLYNSRVIVLAGGPATRGPGALPMELLDQAVPEKGRSLENRTVAAALDVGAALGEMASKIGVAVDIFTSTDNGFNTRLLTSIAHGSGGELMPQVTAPHHHPLLDAYLAYRQATTSAAEQQCQHPEPQQLPPPSQQGQKLKADSFHVQDATGPKPSTSSIETSAPAAGVHGSGNTGGFIGGLLSRQLSAALTRRFGLEGRIDCYCSEGLRLVQWLGPLDPIQVEHEENSPAPAATPAGTVVPLVPPLPSAAIVPGGTIGGPYRLSSTACGVVAMESGRCASLRLEVTRDLDDVSSLLLQVALHFVDPRARCRVVRVVTRRLAVVESRGEYLRTVNPTAAAALFGKRAVLEAKRAGAFRDSRKAEEARYAVGAQLGLVATRCGQEVQASRGVLGFGARKSRQWPPELMPLAYALYHFHRGPLLGPPGPPPPGTFPTAAHSHLHALWDSDVRLAGFNGLLRAAWGDAYRSMAPKLYAVLPSQSPAPTTPIVQLVALPCVSLAAVMARTAPLILDVGTVVLVSPTEEPGHGQGNSNEAIACGLTPALLSAARQAVVESSSSTAAGGSEGVSRFPVPSVVLAPRAQTGGGALAARLIPVHRDGYLEQCLQHPQLKQLGPAVAAQLSKQLVEGSAKAAAFMAELASAAGLPPALAKQAVTAGLSFVEWCRGVHVQPFPST